MDSTTQDLVSALYNSADPLCAAAAKLIEEKERNLSELDRDLDLLASSCRLMLEALMEIYKVAIKRDDGSAKELTTLLKELNLRLKECGNIANDTINLQTVQSVFRGYYY